MKVAIIANGNVNDKKFHLSLLKEVDKIICADGGADNAFKLGITPDLIIGDFDSVKSIAKFKGKCEIIEDKDQDKTDTFLAIEEALKLNPDEIIFLGVIGTRFDHTLTNILELVKLKENIKARIIDEHNEIELVTDSIKISGKKGNIVSVIPLTDVTGLTYSGLHWEVTDKEVSLGWSGSSNVMSENNATISLKTGKILVIKARD